ncbi:MAG TPA: nucleotide exchange factor GrpE [Bacillales bacterium]|nr:nucleotide exchange factor GrpE [Bacillales bacterium]
MAENEQKKQQQEEAAEATENATDQAEPEDRKEADPPPADESESGGRPDAEVSTEALMKQIEQLEKEKEELRNKYLRTQADYDNFRRRTREEKAADAKYRSQKLAEKLLPVIDNFDRALNVQAETEDAKSLKQGMEIVHRQLNDVLGQENIQEIEAEGKPFDPQYHQAVMQVEDENHEPNTVVEVMQKGYVLNDRVLRPAMVKVTQ